MPIDPLYEDSTSAYLRGLGDIPLPAEPALSPSTTFGSVSRAVGRGLGQGGAALAGAAADTGAAVGTLTTGPDSLAFDPVALAASDQQENIARAKGGRLFESPTGAAAYSFSDSLKPDPTNTTRIDQIVQGAVSGLTQIVPAAVLGGPLAGAVVGGASMGLSRAEDLKREGVDVGTRAAVGGVEGVLGGAGAVLPAGGSTLARTLGLVAVGGPGMAIGQGAAERAILRNAGYDHLADQIDPLDPTNLAASTLMAGVFGGVHAVGLARAGRAANAPAAAVDPTTPLPSLDLAARKALPYNSPVLDAYATQVAQQNGVPPAMLLFIKNAGERSNSNQVSPAGAKGVMQFTDPTWRAFGQGDPTDPINSIDAAGRYAKDLLQRYNGDVRAALTEYNGGVAQARAVAAGGRPTADETIAYLNRYDDYAANRAIDDFHFNPTPDQVDAALLARGQRIVDDAYVFGTPDDVNGMAMHQDAFELAARQMDDGGFPDMTRFYTPDDATRAATLDGLIADAESQHADLSTAAANLADPGGIAAARAELDTLNAAAPDTSPAAVKELTRQIQAQGAKFKAAERQAQQQIDALQADYESRVTRLQAAIQRNAEAQRANDQLPGLNEQLTALRQQRAAIDVPATRRTQLSDFVAAVARAQRESPAAPARAPRDAVSEAAGATPPPIPPRGPGSLEAAPRPAGTGEASGAAPSSALETNLRAQAEVSPELPVELDATRGEFRGALADALKVIDEEHAASVADSKLMDVAANCFITTLG